MVLLIQFFLLRSIKCIFSARAHISHLWLSKVIDFGTNRKHVCDFLLIRYSNLGLTLPHFRDVAGFMLRNWPSPIPPEFCWCSH